LRRRANHDQYHGRFKEAVSNLDTVRLAGRALLDSLDVEGRVCDDLGLALQGMGDFAGAVSQHYYAIDLARATVVTTGATAGCRAR
jgi:hypothetical protein